MAKTLPRKKGKGTLIRGAEGALYFVTDNKLRASRVPENKADDVRAALERWSAGGGKTPLTAVPAKVADTHGIDIPLRAAGRRKSRLGSGTAGRRRG